MQLKNKNKNVRAVHPISLWLWLGTCSAAVTQSLDYLGVQCWQTAEMLTTQQLWFSTQFSESEKTISVFLSQDIGITTLWKQPYPTPNKHLSLKPHYFWFGKLGVINQLFCLLGQGNWKEKAGE